VKKEDQDARLVDSDLSLIKDLKKESFKKTNINILLNRVRLEKKRTLKKRIIISFFLIAILSALTVYFAI
jgi:hypothetical protein